MLVGVLVGVAVGVLVGVGEGVLVGVAVGVGVLVAVGVAVKVGVIVGVGVGSPVPHPTTIHLKIRSAPFSGGPLTSSVIAPTLENKNEPVIVNSENGRS